MFRRQSCYNVSVPGATPPRGVCNEIGRESGVDHRRHPRIGAATALVLAERGADVALVGRHDDDEARQVAARIEKLGRARH